MIDNFVADSSDKNVSIFLIFLILYKNSDENHPLTINAINELLESKYQGIHLDRKTLGKKLNTLMSVLNDEEDFPFSIAKIPNKGWCINERPFVDEQIIFLMDSIYSNKSISFAEANDLCDSINRCLSKYQVKEKYCDYKSSDVNKNIGVKETLYSISVIREAIKENKSISYHQRVFCMDLKDFLKYSMVVTPHYLVNKNGIYYLLATKSRCATASFIIRVENMCDIKIENDVNSIDIKKTKFGKNFSIVDFKNNQLTIKEGTIKRSETKPIKALFITDWLYFNFDKHFKRQYFDLFENNIQVEKERKIDYTYFSLTASEHDIFDFALKNVDKVELFEPTYIREKVVETIYKSYTSVYKIPQNSKSIKERLKYSTTLVEYIDYCNYFFNEYKQTNEIKYFEYSYYDTIKVVGIIHDELIKIRNNVNIELFVDRTIDFLYKINYNCKGNEPMTNAYYFLREYLLADIYYPILKNSFCIDKENIDIERALNHLNSSKEFYNDKTYELLKDELELLHIDKEDLNPETVIKKIIDNTKQFGFC